MKRYLKKELKMWTTEEELPMNAEDQVFVGKLRFVVYEQRPYPKQEFAIKIFEFGGDPEGYWLTQEGQSWRVETPSGYRGAILSYLETLTYTGELQRYV